MKIIEFIMEILKVCNNDCYLQVMIDDDIPKPFEGVFKMERRKGFLLFKRREEESK